jgi:hypothetical protein
LGVDSGGNIYVFNNNWYSYSPTTWVNTGNNNPSAVP